MTAPPCDTLGIDNHPLAGFTWEADTLNTLLVEFTDVSHYEPTDWLWDFGDGGTGSMEVNPLYEYASSGTYLVCLTVSNQYGSDTFCKYVTVGVSGTGEEGSGAFLKVYPNPASDRVQVIHSGMEEFVLVMSDFTGREVMRRRLGKGEGKVSLETGSLPSGVYFLQVLTGNKPVHTEKIIIIR